MAPCSEAFPKGHLRPTATTTCYVAIRRVGLYSGHLHSFSWPVAWGGYSVNARIPPPHTHTYTAVHPHRHKPCTVTHHTHQAAASQDAGIMRSFCTCMHACLTWAHSAYTTTGRTHVPPHPPPPHTRTCSIHKAPVCPPPFHAPPPCPIPCPPPLCSPSPHACRWQALCACGVSVPRWC